MIDTSEQFLGLCDHGCGALVFHLEHHYTHTHGQFEPVPWQPPAFIPADDLREAIRLAQEKAHAKEVKLAPFRYSLALLDFDTGTYSLVQPVRSSKPQPGTYFLPHDVLCEKVR